MNCSPSTWLAVIDVRRVMIKTHDGLHPAYRVSHFAREIFQLLAQTQRGYVFLFIPIGSTKKPAKGVFFQDQTLKSVLKKDKKVCLLPLRSEKGNVKE